MKRRASLALTIASGLASAALAIPSSAIAQQPGPGTQNRDGAVSLREVDIRAFIEDVANATGRTFIVDPRVAGNVTVIATQALSSSELFEVFLSTLRVNGYVASPTASGAYRIVPDDVAARDPTGPGALGPDADRYVTQVFPLRYADAEGVATAVRPILSPRGALTTIRRGNSIVVVDYGSTVSRVRDVVRSLDRDLSALRSMRLSNISANEVARVLQSVLAADGGASLQVVPVPSSNSVVLRGEPALLDRYAPLVEEMDVGAEYRRSVMVLPLKFAVAEEIMPILQQISASLETAPPADGEGPAPNRRANIASHRATNSIVISAEPDTQEALAEVVRSLDVRRQQVRVEAVIVEVSDVAAKELGLQFLATGDGGNAIPFLSTSYAGAAPNLLAVTGALLTGDDDGSDGSSVNPAIENLRRAAVESVVGVNGGLFGVGGRTNSGSVLGLIVNALGQDQGSNVLSTPSVMTLDNETATFLVGQQIPVTTGEALGSDNLNPFRTVRREDVGVQLEVRPQVSEGGAIRLNIRQEVSSIFGPVTPNSFDLITNRREIETVVQVDAGEIVALGGLIQEDVQTSEQGVPGLRRLPLIGRLFRSESKTRQRTNLMVFLRPTLVNTPEQARSVTLQQFQAVQGFEGLDPAIRERIERDLFEPEAATTAQPES
ncbi:type II secretion system protein GspD [bacterium]|nr:type II secretion system protein GspD [bacterium]